MLSLSLISLALLASATPPPPIGTRDPTHIGSSKPSRHKPSPTHIRSSKVRKTVATAPAKHPNRKVVCTGPKCPTVMPKLHHNKKSHVLAAKSVAAKSKTDQRKLHKMARLRNAVDGKSAAKSMANRLASRIKKRHTKMREQEIYKIIRNGDVTALNRMAKNGVKIDLNKKAYGSHQHTATHIAVDYHDAQMVEALLKLGANPKATDTFGWSPLHHAVANESPEIVSILLDAAGDHETTLSKTTAHEMVEDSPDSEGVLNSIFEFWKEHGQHKENHKGWYRIVSPNGVAYRKTRDFGARLQNEHSQAGVYHGAIVKTVDETEQWVQLTNGYFLPKYRHYPVNCTIPTPEKPLVDHDGHMIVPEQDLNASRTNAQATAVHIGTDSSEEPLPDDETGTQKVKCTTKVVFLEEDQPQKLEL